MLRNIGTVDFWNAVSKAGEAAYSLMHILNVLNYETNGWSEGEIQRLVEAIKTRASKVEDSINRLREITECP